MSAASVLPPAPNSTPSSYRAWMQLHPDVTPTVSSLEGYVSALGPEWWDSELKEAVSDLGDLVGPRKSVAGLANRYGGELLLGVTNEGFAAGTPMSWERVEAALQQPNATRSGAYISDLTFAIRVPPVVVEVTPGARWAYIVEVVQQAIPVYTWDQDHHRFDLFVRFAGGTRNLRAVEALDWLQERTRARTLRTIYLEFDTVSRIAVHDQDYSVGFSPVMPYLQRCLEDGTLYTALSADDRKQLLGEALQGARSGGSVGFVGGLLRLGKIMETSRRILERSHPEWTLQQVEDNLWSWHVNKWNELKQSREAFKAWLVGQGIRIE